MGVNENLSARVIQREKNSICINPDKNEHQKGVPKISKAPSPPLGLIPVN